MAKRIEDTAVKGSKVPGPMIEFERDKKPREAILKLATMVTQRMPQHFGKIPITVNDPEYFGFAAMATDEMAEVALKMKVRHPRTFADMKRLTGMEDDYLNELLQKMSDSGLIEYNWENKKHEKQWVLPMFVPGSAEFSNMNSKLMEEHPEVAIFFEQMSRLPMENVAPIVPPGGAGLGMHVIPVEAAIPTETKSLSIEHISHWLEYYHGKYAASPCSCRKSREVYDDNCGDDPESWCIAVGDMADYIVETQKGGKYITKEEALEILQKAEDNGFVHQITNIDGKNKIFAICNCNINVCYALRISQLYNTPNMARSAYVARVEKENCVACGRCVEYCPAGAVKLGQKLCRANGKSVKYPKQELPDETKWGPEKWNLDYRNTNRINCYDTGTAPCKTACPAHIAVQGYLKMASQGRYQEALALIKKNNPFPAVCGHICNRRCEDACTRGDIDQAVAIDEVKRFLAEQDIKAETRYIPKKVVPSVTGFFPEKIAVIGGGPAGLSCAFYLAEKGYSPTVFEKNPKAGGMLTYGIPSFKLEKDVIDAEIEVIREMGVEIRTGVEVGKDITIEELRKKDYRAFYIAIGCQGGRNANIPGEAAEGVENAVAFLRKINLEEKYDFTGDVVVIGGGNVAVDVARSAARCGAPSVSMYCLEQRQEMPAAEEEIREAMEDQIHLSCGWGPKEIIVENGKVTGIILKRCMSVFDENHRFAPVYNETDTKEIRCSHVLLSIGQSIEWGNLLDNSRVELGRGKNAVADSLTYQTAEPDIFVGGDVYTGPRFAIDAIAAGKQGAISIHRFVRPHSTLVTGRNREDFIELNKNDISVRRYDHTPRQVNGVNREIPKLSFRESKLTFTEEQVKKETARCLGCGASIVDENKCIGCGVCTTKCGFDAIHLFRERPECSKMMKSEDKMKGILPYAAKRAIKIKRKETRAKEADKKNRK